MGLTEKQLKTIEARGENILVSAAAGSGKTTVLTERILRLVTKDLIPLKELLVVTFTEAAASEMKSRIAAALTAASENDSFAEAQLRQIGSAKIMTFHAFCLTVIRRYHFAIELDPSFMIADEKRAEALREEALDEVMASAFLDKDKDFQSAFTGFLHAYSDVRNERKVREMILKTYEFIMTLPEPFVWLTEKIEESFGLKADLNRTPAFRFANDEIAYRLSLARALTEETGTLLMSQGLSGLAAKNAIDLETVSGIERRFHAGDREGTRRLLAELSFETFRASATEKELHENIKSLVNLRRDRVKNILRNELRAVFFARPEKEYTDDIAHLAPYAKTLEALVKRFSDTYLNIKRGEKVIDFNDFEHMALKILKDENIADDYRRRLSFIFIDEYQDSNYVQEALISRISREDNVFMVGDVKQSIYSWRNAAPEIFLEKQKNYRVDKVEGTAESGSAGSTGLLIGLSSNFRSKAGVIGAVNPIFETIMEQHYSGMDYDDNARLITGIDYDPEWEGKTCLHLIRKDSDKEIFDNDTEGEAALCAEIIRNTAGKPFYDAKNGLVRSIRYGDIAILLRTARGAADVYRSMLEAHGIPAVTDRGSGYFETVEIDTFLGLLRAIVNLRRDVPLAAAMCSAVFGFEPLELADIRAENKDGFFYAAFLAYAENGADEALRKKCIAMTTQLSRWRDEERFMRLDDFLWKLMRESGFFDYAGGLGRGAHRQANLRALLDRAADFQKGRIEGLRGFLAFLDKIKLKGESSQVALLTEGEDVCRIMTIHGSKGLEFPIVLLGGLGRPFSWGGSGEDSLLLHRDIGLSLEWRDPASHTRKKTLLHSAVKLRQDIGERAEIIRLLYVGMTRAMDTLHLIGTIGDPEKWIDTYGAEEIVPAIDTDIFGASNYLHLTLPVALKRKGFFEVLIENPDCRVAADAASRNDGGDSEMAARLTEAEADDVDIRTAAYEPYIYPYAAAAKLKSKYSVTELCRTDKSDSGALGIREIVKSRADGGVKPDIDAPVFFMAGGKDEAVEDAGLTAAGKGTAVHKAFEALDTCEAFAHRSDRPWFENFLSKLVESGSMSEAEAGSIGAKTFMRFANTELAARAAASGFLIKEAPFNMKLPYREAVFYQSNKTVTTVPFISFETKEAVAIVPLDEEIVVQGVIDCLFEEEDGIVIADFKTGWFDVSIYEREAKRIQAAYGAQLQFYRRAAELIFNKPVKESLIYMTRAGVTVDIT